MTDQWTTGAMESSSPDLIHQLQAWYAAHCDGEWEHAYGVKIDTVDNPGWSVVIDLARTPLADAQFVELKDLEAGDEWIHCVVNDRRFQGHGGPTMLSRIIRVFLEWSSQATVRL
jgi:hypothetical protein